MDNCGQAHIVYMTTMIHISFILSLSALASCSILPQQVPAGSLIRRVSSDGQNQVFMNNELLQKLIKNFLSSPPNQNEHIDNIQPITSNQDSTDVDLTQDLPAKLNGPSFSDPSTQPYQHKQNLLAGETLKQDPVSSSQYQKQELYPTSNRYITQDEIPLKLYRNPVTELPQQFTDETLYSRQQQFSHHISPELEQQPSSKNIMNMYQTPVENPPSTEFQRGITVRNYQPYSQEIPSDAVNKHEEYEFYPDIYKNPVQYINNQSPNNEQQNVQKPLFGIGKQEYAQNIAITPNSISEVIATLFMQPGNPQTFQNDEDEVEASDEFHRPVISRRIQTGAIKIIRNQPTEPSE